MLMLQQTHHQEPNVGNTHTHTTLSSLMISLHYYIAPSYGYGGLNFNYPTITVTFMISFGHKVMVF